MKQRVFIPEISRTYVVLLVLAVGLLALSFPGTAAEPANNMRETVNQTALDRYVAAPDSNYEYHLVNTVDGGNTKTYVLDMTSQSWRKPEEVDRTLWKHWVTIVVPAKVTSSTAMMFVGGGSNGGQPPKEAEMVYHMVAATTESIVAEVGMIPNQPLTFPDDGKPRKEDGIIAYTWDKFMRTGDDQWPLRLPMTKAVVRAMDTVQSFCATDEVGNHKVESFLVAGGSKRGWTTWTTAVVDKRVVAIVPAVIDLLNMVPSFEHHKAVYGFWAPAIWDYVARGVMEWLNTPEFAALMKIVEPYHYRDRLTMPKYIVNAGGDQFFLPDSSQFYINDLKGPTYLRYIPNVDHGLNQSAYEGLMAFYYSIVKGEPLPEYRWSFPDEQTIRVETPSKPTAVKLWQATNPEARDFRIESLGPAYAATELKDEGNGVFVGHVEKPEKGWTAFMVELTFPNGSGAPLILTSPIRITPNTLPFKYEGPQPPPKGYLSK